MSELELARCPTCGRAARVDEAWKNGASSRDPLLIGIRIRCSRLLWPCHRTEFKWNEKGWGDLARKRAREAWNEIVGDPSRPSP